MHTTATCNLILDRIQTKAKEKFGNKWMVNLAKAYVAIAIKNGDSNATVVNRRPQLERIFRRGNCNADSLFILAEAVGYKFQMIYIHEEIEKL